MAAAMRNLNPPQSGGFRRKLGLGPPLFETRKGPKALKCGRSTHGTPRAIGRRCERILQPPRGQSPWSMILQPPRGQSPWSMAAAMRNLNPPQSGGFRRVWKLRENFKNTLTTPILWSY